jgi:M6 family metalloprotease-like protein
MKYLILIPLFLFCISSHAQKRFVSAAPYSIDVPQADGTSVKIRGYGDEYSHLSVSEDGYTILRNKKGYYEYASKNKLGVLSPSGVRVKNIETRTRSEKKFLTKTTKYLSADQSLTSLKSAVSDDGLQKAFPSSGSRKTLLLLIKYPDLEDTYTVGDLDNLMNQSDYNGTGSFRDYYLDTSDGELSMSVDVVGWYTAANNYEYYGEDSGDDRARELVAEAIDSAEAAGVDFSQYDNDNDGYVDDLMIVHAGPGAEEGSQTQYIWSHSWSLSSSQQRTYDGVTISSYIINPETRDYGMVGIGVLCHEFGHALGLPDLYDTNDDNGDSEGLGNWCLMASGGWLSNESKPAMMSAWCRNELGWISPTILTSNGQYTLSPAASGTSCYKIPTSKTNEYFLLENRYKTGLDSSLPGSGLAIYHINTDKSSNADEDDKFVDLEEADGLNHLDKSSNRGDSGDVFPGSSDNNEFNDTTNPDAENNDGTATGIVVQDIQLVGSTVYFTYSEIEPYIELSFSSIYNDLDIVDTEVNIDLRVVNNGTQDAGSFKVAYYLSTNSTISTSDYLLGTQTISSLNAGTYQSLSFTKEVNDVVPVIPEGNYYVGYIIDYDDDIEESDETNNSYIFTSPQLELSHIPNLTFIASENALEIEDYNVSMTLNVENDGNEASEACTIGVYVTTQSSVKTSDYLVGEISLGSLESGEAVRKSFSANVLDEIPNLPLGFYSVGYYIDNGLNIDEASETDNDYTFPNQQIDHDLHPNLTSVFESSVLEITSYQLNFEMLVSNNGEIVSPGSEVEFYLSEDSIITKTDLFLTSVAFDGIDLDDTFHVATSYEITNLEELLLEGYYFLGYIIDSENTIEELDETDNVYTYTEQFHYCPPDVTQLSETICEGDSFSFQNTTLSQEGIYEFVFQNQAGCDSVIVLEILVNPTNQTELNEVICRNEKVTIGNMEYTDSGVYTQVFSNKYGCDSTVTLYLKVIEPVVTTLLGEICDGEHVEVAGQNYYETGVYENTVQSHTGCDSTILLNLTVRQFSDTLLTKVICKGETFYVGDSAYSESGIYTNLLTNKHGCDSLVTLHLTVNPIHEVDIFENICAGASYLFGGIDFNSSGIYPYVYVNQYGCDSLVTLHLTVIPIPVVDLGSDFTMFTSESIQLDAGATYASYLWSTGETSQTITIDKTKGLGLGIYSVMVTDEFSCEGSDEISVHIYDDTDPDNDKEPLLKIFPNPTQGDVNLLIEEVQGTYKIRILSINGNRVYQNEFSSSDAKFVKSLNMHHLLPGMYSVQIISGETVLVEKFIRAGN